VVGAARGTGILEPPGSLQAAVAEAVEAAGGREAFSEDAVTNTADEVLRNVRCESVIPITMRITMGVLQCVCGRHFSS